MAEPGALPEKFPFIPACLFTDVDDTLTWQGKMPVETFSALDALQKAGVKVVPITGGSSGWCDCMLRTWPIDTIIGENGAICMWMNEEGKLVRQFAANDDERKGNSSRLEDIAIRVQQEVPEAEVSLDTAFRLTDIAFDIGQQCSLGQKKIDEIVAICLEMGANAKASSIHVNVWFGNVSKAHGAENLLKRLDLSNQQAIFIGDSPNDESMFSQFDVTIGVANIRRYLQGLPKIPTYITRQPGGYGFVELAEALFAAKSL